jgi:hypothetical protein
MSKAARSIDADNKIARMEGRSENAENQVQDEGSLSRKQITAPGLWDSRTLLTTSSVQRK